MPTAAEELQNVASEQVVEMLSYAWIESLMVNACGYASVIVPGFLLIQYLKRSNYLERHGIVGVLVTKFISICLSSVEESFSSNFKFYCQL